VRLPKAREWLFWEVDVKKLDTRKHACSIIARVVEFGCLADVRWLIETCGMERIHRFFRDEGHTEISDRTLAFRRAVFEARGEAWASPPAWRRLNGDLWVD